MFPIEAWQVLILRPATAPSCPSSLPSWRWHQPSLESSRSAEINLNEMGEGKRK